MDSQKMVDDLLFSKTHYILSFMGYTWAENI